MVADIRYPNRVLLRTPGSEMKSGCGHQHHSRGKSRVIADTKVLEFLRKLLNFSGIFGPYEPYPSFKQPSNPPFSLHALVKADELPRSGRWWAS